MQRKWWIAGIGIVLIGGSAGGWWYWKDDPAPAEAAVVTTTVQRGELVSSISGTGGIEPSERETIVSAVAGEVAEVFFKDGDTVKKGDVLLTFEQEDTADQLASKRFDLQKQRLSLEQLQLEYKQAAEAGAETQQSIAITIRQQELTIAQTENEIASLESESEDDIEPVTAPIDGKLSGFDVEPGDTLREDAELGEVVNSVSMKMVVGVDELDIAQVALGQEASILVDALPERSFAGVVSAIAEEGTSNNGVASFDVTVLLTAVDGLKAGMSAEASIVTAKKEDALILPIDAVQSFRGQYFVMVPSAVGGTTGEAMGGQAATARPQSGGMQPQGGGRAANAGAAAGQTRVFVEVGIHNEDSIEIVSGLSEGDRVILPTTAAASGTTAGPQAGFGVGGFGGGVVGIPGGFGGGTGRPAGDFGGGGAGVRN